MNYRGFSDLDLAITSNLYRLPRGIDLIVGIPRSGMLPASILALQLNIPLTDIDGLIAHRIFSSGRRLKKNAHEIIIENARKILIIDDSIASGREMKRIKNMLSEEKYKEKFLFAAVFAVEEKIQEVDYYFDICPLPRVFAWNVFHQFALTQACVDIDGVLCVDPTEEENNGEENYRHFLLHAKPLFIPTVEVGALVSLRLEKYRAETVKWLEFHNIKFRDLYLLNVENKKEGQKSCDQDKYKAEVFLKLKWANFFIESKKWQAEAIAEISRKPVICTQDNKLYLPSTKALMRGAVKKSPRIIRSRLNRLKKLAHSKMLLWNRW